MIQRAISVRRKLGNDHHPEVKSDLLRLEELARQADQDGRHNVAAANWQCIWQHQSEILGSSNASTLNALSRARQAAVTAEDWTLALELSQAELSLSRERTLQQLSTKTCLVRVAQCLDRQNNPADVVPLLEEYLSLPSGVESPTAPQTLGSRLEPIEVRTLLGKSLLTLKEISRAEDILLPIETELAQLKSTSPVTTKAWLVQMVRLYELKGEDAAVAIWKERLFLPQQL